MRNLVFDSESGICFKSILPKEETNNIRQARREFEVLMFQYTDYFTCVTGLKYNKTVSKVSNMCLNIGERVINISEAYIRAILTLESYKS